MKRIQLALPLLAGIAIACGESTPPADVGADTPSFPDTVDAGRDVEPAADAPETDPTVDTDAGVDAVGSTGSGLFAEGCPVSGSATARQIAVDASLDGDAALGGRDDWLIMNEHAAFVIQDVRYATDPGDEVHTWWYFGGQPIDAVAMDGCDQAGPDRFDEMGLLVGEADVAALDQSILRGFRADSIELVSDGADGSAAVVRATGSDDRFWLIELELVRRAFSAGRPTGLSDPLGVEIVVDYILAPDSPVLRIEMTTRNVGEETRSLVGGTINFFGDGTTVSRFNRSTASVGGLTLPIGIPWLSGTARDGTWTVALESGTPLSLSVSGVDAFVDVGQFLAGANIRPGDERTDTYFFAVGNGGLNTTIRHFHALDPEPSVGLLYQPAPLSVRAVDAVSGDALSGVEVVVETVNDSGEWLPVDGFFLDAEGTFSGEIPDFAGDAPYRARATLGGRPRPAPIEFDPTNSPELEFVFERSGSIRVEVVDDGGTPLPSKVIAWDAGREVTRAYHVDEPAVLELPPGDYELTVTRGFEYAPFIEAVTVAADEVLERAVTLPRVLDTTGFMSMDGHIHGGPSPDSGISIPLRLTTVAAEGVEIAVSTDHEAMVPWAPYIEPAGLDGWITTVLGAEVTATLPEHSNAYPFSDLTDEHPRGRPVRWYGMAPAEFYAASRARGAEVVALNHPRNGCAYMCLIEYDRMTGEALMDRPEDLGFAPDAELWSWDFDSIEFMNGHASPFVDPGAPNASGLFEDWMSFHNLGHRITATGVTDVHGLDAQGSPRNFVAMPTDEPAEFDESMLVDAILGGRSLVSAGAFARVSIDGATMGDEVSVDGSGTLSLEVQALEEIDVTDVLVFTNCDEVARVAATDPDAIVKLDTTVELAFERDAHVVVVGFGRGAMPLGLRQYNPAGVPRFVTNPIFVDANGDGVFTPPGGKTCSYTLPSAEKNEVGPNHERLLEPVFEPLLHDFRSVCDEGHEH